MKRFLIFIISLPKNLAIILVSAYQVLLSPDHSWLKVRYPYGYCRHYPSCSQYTKESLARFGFVKGVYLGLKRILHCHPWAEPKVDPVPQSF